MRKWENRPRGAVRADFFYWDFGIIGIYSIGDESLT